MTEVLMASGVAMHLSSDRKEWKKKMLSFKSGFNNASHNASHVVQMMGQGDWLWIILPLQRNLLAHKPDYTFRLLR